VGVLVCAAWVTGVARPVMGRGEPPRIAYARSIAHARSHASASRVPIAKASIVGGVAAQIAEYPFQVALYDPQAGSPAAGFFCGGVILDATHVVTAAHCIVGAGDGHSSPAGDLAVLAGSTSLSSLTPGSVEDPVQASVYDRRYNPITSDYDVALLTLARPLWPGSASPAVNGSNTIAPLPIDSAGALAHGNPNLAAPPIATSSGWGDVNPSPAGSPAYPASLQAVRMPLVSDGLCEEEYSAIEQLITPRMICAGGGRTHVDTCYGDSGGPLLVDRNSPPHPPEDYVLVGLVDFGNGCAQHNFPGVYASIANPDIARFLQSGTGHRAVAARGQARHRHKHRKRHRHGLRRNAGA
jgi:secreted trypsin-like serine protease